MLEYKLYGTKKVLLEKMHFSFKELCIFIVFLSINIHKWRVTNVKENCVGLFRRTRYIGSN